MGDQAIIHFTNGQEIGPAIYLHWDGYRVSELLSKAQKVMEGRIGDVPYTTARAIGVACEMIPGSLSLGCWSGPEARDYEGGRKEITDPSYSHGCAGVFLVDCRTWEVENFNGYGFR